MTSGSKGKQELRLALTQSFTYFLFAHLPHERAQQHACRHKLAADGRPRGAGDAHRQGAEDEHGVADQLAEVEGLQPYAPRAATLCVTGCNLMC